MHLVRSVVEAAAFRGLDFVPTMGALHEGHRALIAAAARQGGKVIVSIFVNPTQFAPGEDYDRYPRTLEADLEICRAEGVTAVFTPTAADIYPAGFATSISVAPLADVMCGAHRPGHFAGVATVVARLFGILRPRRAIFGWKDAQQFIIIRRMVSDLEMGVELVPIETVRERDGLACSSRNRFLSPEERALAPKLYRVLQKAREVALDGAQIGEITAGARTELTSAGLVPDYVDLRPLHDLSLPAISATCSEVPAPEGWLLAAAVRLGKTRLIDNVRF